MKKNLILEICQNHNGSESLLKEMIHAASETGAKYIKIQDIKSSELTFRPRFEKGKIINKKIITIKRPYDNEYKRPINSLLHEYVAIVQKLEGLVICNNKYINN